MITHYIPQWLLSRFGKPVYELDIYNGHVSTRTLSKAGSDVDLWPEEIEKELMGQHDNDAARVFRYWINGRRRIVLPDERRDKLALWLALFMIRVPLTRDSINKQREEALADPQAVLDHVVKDRQGTLAHMRKTRPEAYDGIISVLGQYAGEAWLMAMAARIARELTPKVMPDIQTAYSHYLKTSNIHGFARAISHYHWTWLYSRHDFVISDNPLMRWHELSQRWNYGILRSGVAITMPLGSRLCLLMTQRKRNDHGQLMYCPRGTVAEFNRRQRLTALEHVYSGDRDLLKAVAVAQPKRPKRGPMPNFQSHRDR